MALWRIIRSVNRTLRELHLIKYPDKTFIGKIEKGFDFHGYHFSPEGLTIAQDLVSRNGGLIEFSSRPGSTVFQVRLPLTSEANAT